MNLGHVSLSLYIDFLYVLFCFFIAYAFPRMQRLDYIYRSTSRHVYPMRRARVSVYIW